MGKENKPFGEEYGKYFTAITPKEALQFVGDRAAESSVRLNIAAPWLNGLYREALEYGEDSPHLSVNAMCTNLYAIILGLLEKPELMRHADSMIVEVKLPKLMKDGVDVSPWPYAGKTAVTGKRWEQTEIVLHSPDPMGEADTVTFSDFSSEAIHEALENEVQADLDYETSLMMGWASINAEADDLVRQVFTDFISSYVSDVPAGCEYIPGEFMVSLFFDDIEDEGAEGVENRLQIPFHVYGWKIAPLNLIPSSEIEAWFGDESVEISEGFHIFDEFAKEITRCDCGHCDVPPTPEQHGRLSQVAAALTEIFKHATMQDGSYSFVGTAGEAEEQITLDNIFASMTSWYMQGGDRINARPAMARGEDLEHDPVALMAMVYCGDRFDRAAFNLFREVIIDGESRKFVMGWLVQEGKIVSLSAEELGRASMDAELGDASELANERFEPLTAFTIEMEI